jgi:selenide,water dikinase
MSKAGARPGDRLILTKPLGTGVITTAAKNDRATPAHLQGAVDWMLRLNGPASQVLSEAGVRACTDITGFGLLGHASEMAQAGGVLLRISASAVPVLDGALDYVRQKQVPGGTGRNRDYLTRLDGEPEAAHPTGYQTEVRVRLHADIPRETLALLFDPQTSGGLFAAVPPAALPDVRARLEDAGVPVWEVGEVDEGRGIVVEQ